jgi:ribonuclease HI
MSTYVKAFLAQARHCLMTQEANTCPRQFPDALHAPDLDPNEIYTQTTGWAIFSDGGFNKENPTRLGLGGIIKKDNITIHTMSHLLIVDHPTSSVATEFYAHERILRHTLSLLQSATPSTHTEIPVYTDCLSVVEIPNGTWHCTNQEILGITQRIRELRHEFKKLQCKVQTIWIPRAKNSEADAQATKALNSA